MSVRQPEISKHVLSRPNYDMDFYLVRFDGKELRFVDTNEYSRRRSATLFQKEPTTIIWMDHFERGEVMFDVGANIGTYSIYAAVVSGAEVYAFEPESLNYAELNKNIFLNKLHGQCTGYNLAVSDASFKMDELFVSYFCPGFSQHDFGENRWAGEERKLSRMVTVKGDERLRQGSVSVALDDVVFTSGIKHPDHIKIDVDGFEDKVVDGMEKLIHSDKLQTVLVETEYRIPGSMAIIDKMKEAGWRWSWDQMRVNQHEVLTEEVVRSRMEAKKGGQNIIYYKDPKWDDIFARFAETFVPPNPNK